MNKTDNTFEYIRKKQALESSIHRVITNQTFLGSVLQCMNINYSEALPTAGVHFDSKLKKFVMLINPKFFIDKLTIEQRVAILFHELYHITHKHVFFEVENMEFRRLNVAMDLVINQLIKDLPKEAMMLEYFEQKDGSPFPKNSTTELYYKLLEDANYTGPQGDGEGEGFDQVGSDGEGGNESSKGESKGKGKGKIPVKDLLAQGKGEFDKHDWDSSDMKEKMEAMKDLLKRAMYKAAYSHSQLPEHVRDLLSEIDTRISKLDYKAILLATLKKSMPSKDTIKTWKRPSRRYGDLAKGNQLGVMPKIELLIDTSGSISVEEVNEFLQITDNFLNVGVEKATLNLFHTQLYHTQKIKKKAKVEKDNFQSGGTDLTSSFEHVIKTKPDLCIIITDGYWGMPNIDIKKLPQCVFVISKGGTVDHPMKNIGKTVKYG